MLLAGLLASGCKEPTGPEREISGPRSSPRTVRAATGSRARGCRRWRACAT
ncbi:hypothetical protein [Nannocystis pusilla]|uniref:hypothetical protein n=1 Tax=Nannocystis pusilla TaxID=889268 RepID=UPI003B81C961